MTDDHTALQRLVAQIEAKPTPTGWFARLRHASELRHAEAMLDWEDTRREGRDALTPIRNQLLGGFFLLWVGGTASALFLAHRPLRYLPFAAVQLALFLGFGLIATKLTWKAKERDFARFLARARALPALPPADGSGAAS